MTAPLPFHPGWHRMPMPAGEIAARWSEDAWDALYPDIRASWWKPWPWPPKFEFKPPIWPDLRTYICPGCMRRQYEPGYCGICGPAWIAAQARKPYILPIITSP